MNIPLLRVFPRRRAGFSLVELLAAVTIIGVIAFMAIPAVSRMREDSERNLAIARVEALNTAMATFIQVNGRTNAETAWSATGTSDEAKYTLLRPYLAFAEASLARFMPEGYNARFQGSILTLTKTRLLNPDNAELYY
jgi:prepilin-type N-terminal cleavage/methylation domain-containing protein